MKNLGSEIHLKLRYAALMAGSGIVSMNPAIAVKKAGAFVGIHPCSLV